MFYSKLRWKIADLEKKLEEEKAYSKRLRKDLEMYIYSMYGKDREINEMKEQIHALGKKDGATDG